MTRGGGGEGGGGADEVEREGEGGEGGKPLEPEATSDSEEALREMEELKSWSKDLIEATFPMKTTLRSATGNQRGGGRRDSDGEEWLPSDSEERQAREEEEEEEEELVEGDGSDASEYYTDEELGSTGGRRKGGGRRRKLRPVSSGESDSELVETNWGRSKRRVMSVRRGGNQLDDGNEELYRLRIRYIPHLYSPPSSPP